VDSVSDLLSPLLSSSSLSLGSATRTLKTYIRSTRRHFLQIWIHWRRIGISYPSPHELPSVVNFVIYRVSGKISVKEGLFKPSAWGLTRVGLFLEGIEIPCFDTSWRPRVDLFLEGIEIPCFDTSWKTGYIFDGLRIFWPDVRTGVRTPVRTGQTGRRVYFDLVQITGNFVNGDWSCYCVRVLRLILLWVRLWNWF